MRETGKGPLEAVKDPLYRLTRTDRTNPGATPPNQWTWNYDAVGNRTSAQKDSEATTSSYNEKNQLTGATGGGKMLWRGTLDEPGTATFSSATINGQPARMLAGNVFEATLDLPAGANNVTIQAQDGSGNIATKVYSVNVIGVPSSHTYDANGNLTAKTEGADSWTYTWNALNELTAVAKNAVTQATYSYDPQGRRVEKVAGATTTAWAYDGEDILRQTAGGATTQVVHGPGFDEPLAVETGGAASYLHTDWLGSVSRRTSSAGQVTQELSYDPWGQIETGTPDVYGFTSREWDSAAKLNFYRARWYDPSAGRFLSEDPLGSDGGDDNFYLYVANKPTNLVDPSGLQFAPGQSYQTGQGYKTGPPPNCQLDCMCLANCIEQNTWSSPFTAGGHAANAGGNAATGGTKRMGFGGVKPHPTSWQHKTGGMLARACKRPWVGRAAKAAGRGTVAFTIFEGFYDWGLIFSCTITCTTCSCSK